MKSNIMLWLDDTRDPAIFCKNHRGDIIWIQSYHAFVEWISQHGVPPMISFDHDLGKLKEKQLLLEGYSKKQARALKGQELSGYDCAKWLVDFCCDRGLNLPEYTVHSSNPVGKLNIESYIENARKHLFLG